MTGRLSVGAAVFVSLLAAGLLWTARPRGPRVHLVGAGVISEVNGEDAPSDVRYVLDVTAHASFEETSRRVASVVQLWPDVVVIGLDADQLRTSSLAVAQRTLSLLVRQAENATAVPVLLSVTPNAGASADVRRAAAELHVWWRDVLCRQRGLRLCVDLTGLPGAPALMKAAIGQAVLDALVRQEQLRASTQQGGGQL